MVIQKHKIRVAGYRFKSSFWNKQILQIGELLQDWDINTGRDFGQPYVSYRNASKKEAKIFLDMRMK